MSGGHLHENMKGKRSDEKSALKIGMGLGWRFMQSHGNKKGRVSEKVVLKEGWSLIKGFTVPTKPNTCNTKDKCVYTGRKRERERKKKTDTENMKGSFQKKWS